MSGFATIIGQDQSVRILSALIRKKTLPQAMMFIGADGIGKRTTALAFAKACKCKERHKDGDFCDHCKTCKRIQSFNHPDVQVIEPSGKFIKIDQIRELTHILSMKPFEEGIRVSIISDAQTMNPEAQNALLKALEEPPKDTIQILTAPETSSLLPTIASRCHPFRFRPISEGDLEAFVIRNFSLTSERASLIASLANGSFEKAINLASSDQKIDWIKWRNGLINSIDLNQGDTIHSQSVTAMLACSEKLFKQKDFIADSLELIRSWFRDILIYRIDPKKIIHKDLKDKLDMASRQMTAPTLLAKIEAIQSAQRKLEANANVRLTLEVLMIRLATL